jgi:hypothetical protein
VWGDRQVLRRHVTSFQRKALNTFCRGYGRFCDSFMMTSQWLVTALMRQMVADGGGRWCRAGLAELAARGLMGVTYHGA